MFGPAHLCICANLGKGCLSASLNSDHPSHSCFCRSQRKSEGTSPVQYWDKETLPYLGHGLATFILISFVFYFPWKRIAKSSGASFFEGFSNQNFFSPFKLWTFYFVLVYSWLTCCSSFRWTAEQLNDIHVSILPQTPLPPRRSHNIDRVPC